MDEIEIKDMTLAELRSVWEIEWGRTPHIRIGRKMLEQSLLYKIREKQGKGLTAEQQDRLDKMVTTYRRNPNGFLSGRTSLKPGVRLVRNWQGTQHRVTVTENSFRYKGQNYSSLSKIANIITGSRWNGWAFFGIKK